MWGRNTTSMLYLQLRFRLLAQCTCKCFPCGSDDCWSMVSRLRNWIMNDWCKFINRRLIGEEMMINGCSRQQLSIMSGGGSGRDSQCLHKRPIRGRIFAPWLRILDIAHLHPMFPASCVRVRTGREMSALNKTWSAHKVSFTKCFCSYFMNVILNIDECL